MPGKCLKTSPNFLAMKSLNSERKRHKQHFDPSISSNIREEIFVWMSFIDLLSALGPSQ